jgi:hypothetical protein
VIVSIQVQQRTNMTESEWRPCKRVVLKDGQLCCQLETGKTYMLMKAYEKDLHIRFANADSDKALVNFIRDWGPLYIPNSQIPPDGIVSLPFDLCRAYQKQMKVLIRVLDAFKWAQNEREALEELIKAERLFGKEMLTPLAIVLHITGDILEWAENASLDNVRTATYKLVQSILTAQFSMQFIFQRKGERRQIFAGWEFMNLEEALRWMIWYDEFTKHPVVCCQECRTVFRGKNKRHRKYCSIECGHRAEARKAMRKKRHPERERK